MGELSGEKANTFLCVFLKQHWPDHLLQVTNFWRSNHYICFFQHCILCPSARGWCWL